MKNIVKFIFDKILVFVIAFLITVLFTAFLISGELGLINTGAVTLFLGLFVMFVVELYITKPFKTNHYAHCFYHYKLHILPETLHSMFEDCTFNAVQGFLESEIKAMQIIRDGEIYTSRNHVVGRSGDVTFSLAEVQIADLRKNITVSEDCFFKGIVCDFDYPYFGEGRMDIIGRNYRFCPVKLPEYEDVNSQFKELSYHAIIHTDTPEMITDYISSKWISFLITLEENNQDMVFFSVQNRHLYLVIPNKTNLFDMQTKFGMKMNEGLEKDCICNQLSFIADVLHFFPLYNHTDFIRTERRRSSSEKDYLQLIESMKPHSMAWVVIERILVYIIICIILSPVLLFFK